VNANQQTLFRRHASVQVAQQSLGNIVLTQWMGHWVIIALLTLFIGAGAVLASVASFTPRIEVEGRLVELPGGDIGAELYVPPRALRALHAGDTLKLQYRSYPTPHYDRGEASVSSIASTASGAGLPPHMRVGADADEPSYRVALSLKRHRAIVSDSTPMPLAAGMHFSTAIPLQPVSVAAWILGRRGGHV